jgi:hypothetical protein
LIAREQNFQFSNKNFFFFSQTRFFFLNMSKHTLASFAAGLGYNSAQAFLLTLDHTFTYTDVKGGVIRPETARPLFRRKVRAYVAAAAAAADDSGCDDDLGEEILAELESTCAKILLQSEKQPLRVGATTTADPGDTVEVETARITGRIHDLRHLRPAFVPREMLNDGQCRIEDFASNDLALAAFAGQPAPVGVRLDGCSLDDGSLGAIDFICSALAGRGDSVSAAENRNNIGWVDLSMNRILGERAASRAAIATLCSRARFVSLVGNPFASVDRCRDFFLTPTYLGETTGLTHRLIWIHEAHLRGPMWRCMLRTQSIKDADTGEDTVTNADLDTIQRAHENYFFMRRALRHGNAVDPWTIPTSSTDERINKVIDFLGQCERFVVLKAGDADFVENALDRKLRDRFRVKCVYGAPGATRWDIELPGNNGDAVVVRVSAANFQNSATVNKARRQVGTEPCEVE